jgi:hypothetical protein
MTRWKSSDITIKLKGAKSKTQPKLPAVKANALTKHAMKILDFKGFHVWRQNNAGVFDNNLQVWRANSSTPGISDIIGFHRKTAQFLACEIKAGKDKLSPEQELFLDRVGRSGGIAIVIRTMDDIEALSKREF